MKALVVGYGSIGQRHARLLSQLGHDVAVVSRRDVEAPSLFKTIPNAVAGFAPDYVVIASRTFEHRDDMARLAESGFTGTLLMEKPIFDTGTDMGANPFARVFVAYNLRFHPVLIRLREVLAERTVIAVHASVGQYLPDWRPGTDYRRGYSAIKAQGGGVLRDLSHELDFLNWMLGGWTRLTALGGHFSGLEIDSDDVFSVLFETARCPVVSVQMDYLDRVQRREIVALTDQGSVRADLVGGTLDVDGDIETFAVGRDDTYSAQHHAVLAGGGGASCTLDEGLDVLRMIEAAETTAASRQWIAA